jgi:parvulin-like peptidyl-prolyl isomerase
MGDDFYISVNGDKVDLKSALNYLRGLDDTLLNDIVEMIAGRQYSLEKGINVSEDELQKAVNEFRYLTGLETIEAFNQYLKDRRISVLSFQTAMQNLLLRGKIAATVSDDDIDAHFAENQLSMEQVQLYHIRMDDLDAAEEIKSLLVEEDENFLAMACEHSKDTETAIMGGYIGWLHRDEMIAEIEAAVFVAAKGDIVGPVKTEEGFNVFKVAGFAKINKNDPELRETIRQGIVEDRLAELVETAKVECSLFEN